LPVMKIKDIQANMRNIDIICKVVEKGETREVQTRYGPAKVCAAVLEDETGSIRINLWRGQVDKVRVGDTIHIQNAFVKVFNEQLELNVGGDGRIYASNRSMGK